MSFTTIRRGVISDAEALAELAACTFTETFAADNSAEDLAAHLCSSYGPAQQSAELLDPDVISLLAYRDEELIGFSQIRRKTVPECVTQADPVELHRFYFVQSAHGSGAAREMMLEARQAARELGGQYIWLGVWERNPRAIAFYIKSGFTKVGSHDFMVGRDRQTDWVFVSPLSH